MYIVPDMYPYPYPYHFNVQMYNCGRQPVYWTIHNEIGHDTRLASELKDYEQEPVGVNIDVDTNQNNTYRTSTEASFDPQKWLIVPPRTFDELKVGEVFRTSSRTLTDAHASAFQTVSLDNHPIHYDVEWARRHGHSAPVVHGLQVRAFTAPGATLFPHYIGEVFISFLEVSCSFTGEVHSGDTLYPALTITALEPRGDTGVVVTRTTVHNQRGELVLDGQHKYLLRR